jgi:hypothetical protein
MEVVYNNIFIQLCYFETKFEHKSIMYDVNGRD